MKILYVTNMYPTKYHMYNGIFVKEQIEDYAKKYGNSYQVCLVDGWRSKINYLKSIFTVNFLIAKNRYDLIHIHYGLTGIFLLCNPFIKTPVVLTLHGSDIQSLKKRDGPVQVITKMVVKRVKKIIILNENMLSILKKQESKLVNIPCGIDISNFSSTRKNIHNKSFVLGFPGYKDRPVKNFPLFKKIVAILLAEGHRIEFVEFHNMNRQQVAENLGKLDCLLMTSLSEGSSQMIKEGLASNVPIISSNVGDNKMVLAGVNNCTVINTFDPNDYVPFIRGLLKLTRAERKSNGQAKIKELGLDQESVLKKINALYSNSINK